MIKMFSWRHRLQFLLALSYGLQLLSTFLLHVKGSVGIFEGPHLFGQFGLVSSLRVSEGCQVISAPFFEVSGYWEFESERGQKLAVLVAYSTVI